jgi:phosphoenolpyruvate carboxykinase (ATP)
MVRAALSGALDGVTLRTDPNFGLGVPTSVPGVPGEILDPRSTWSDGAAYDAQAKKLASLFRENDAKFEMPEAVRKAGPQG